jgi:hypothetical protein
VSVDVMNVLRGTPGHRTVVVEAGGQPGDVVKGQVPILVGHPYLLLLGHATSAGRYEVLNGITGLFR